MQNRLTSWYRDFTWFYQLFAGFYTSQVVLAGFLPSTGVQTMELNWAPCGRRDQKHLFYPHFVEFSVLQGVVNWPVRDVELKDVQQEAETGNWNVRSLCFFFGQRTNIYKKVKKNICEPLGMCFLLCINHGSKAGKEHTVFINHYRHSLIVVQIKYTCESYTSGFIELKNDSSSCRLNRPIRPFMRYGVKNNKTNFETTIYSL